MCTLYLCATGDLSSVVAGCLPVRSPGWVVEGDKPCGAMWLMSLAWRRHMPVLPYSAKVLSAIIQIAPPPPHPIPSHKNQHKKNLNPSYLPALFW